MNKEILEYFRDKEEPGEWYDLKGIVEVMNDTIENLLRNFAVLDVKFGREGHICEKKTAEKLIEPLLYLTGLVDITDKEIDECETESKN